jgi:hypothetical protein
VSGVFRCGRKIVAAALNGVRVCKLDIGYFSGAVFVNNLQETAALYV